METCSGRNRKKCGDLNVFHSAYCRHQRLWCIIEVHWWSWYVVCLVFFVCLCVSCLFLLLGPVNQVEMVGRTCRPFFVEPTSCLNSKSAMMFLIIIDLVGVSGGYWGECDFNLRLCNAGLDMVQRSSGLPEDFPEVAGWFEYYVNTWLALRFLPPHLFHFVSQIWLKWYCLGSSKIRGFTEQMFIFKF